MKLIINADDFGFSQETVDATIDCFEKGGLTSATIMPTMPAIDAAVAYAKAKPRFSFGVHLTYVGDGIELPILPPNEVPDLCDKDGKLMPSQLGRLKGLFRRTSIDQIAKETEAQITRIRDLGVPVSHVDSHGHMHKYHPYREALKRVLPKFGITKVRSVQDLYLQKPLKSPNFWLGPHWKRVLDRMFTTTDHLFLPRSAFDLDWTATLLKLPLTGTIEFGLHPGTSEPWRIEEHRDAILLAKRARDQGHTLISWNDL